MRDWTRLVARASRRLAGGDLDVARALLAVAELRRRGQAGRGTAQILGHQVHFAEPWQFGWLVEEIIANQVYAFDSKRPDPKIVDAGANIGLATLFFKCSYPQSQVTAFEPNPISFALLQRNVGDLPGVTLVNAALAEGHGMLTLYRTGTDTDIGVSRDRGLRQLWHDDDEITAFQAKTEPLSSYLNQPVDFVKLDVEGSETMILNEARDKLSSINRLHMEFHRYPGHSLQNMLSLLDEAGFDYKIGNWSAQFAGVATCIISAWR